MLLGPSIEGPRTRVGQPKMKYWKLHKNAVNIIMPKKLDFEQLPKHSFSKLGGGG